jgi:prepilin-type N-terminal cleavage/methylation domain-containing protein
MTPELLNPKRSANVLVTLRVTNPNRSAVSLCRPSANCYLLTPKRSAFTLVELLVVITIIAILAALGTVGIMKAMDTAKNTRIKMEVDMLDAAMKAFKLEYGSFPPCDVRCSSKWPTDSDPTALKYYNLPLRQFLSRAFPRYPHNGPSPTGSTQRDRLMDDLAAFHGGVDADAFHPTRALVTWLSRLSVDSTQPFLLDGPRKSFFEFDKTRLIDQSVDPPVVANDFAFTDHPGMIVYVPSGGANVPYVYFDNRAYRISKTSSLQAPVFFPFGTNNFAVPYVHDMNANKILNVASGESFSDTIPSSGPNGTYDATENISDGNSNGQLDLADDTWANADTFQIISAGQDGLFSGNSLANARVRLYPTGGGYDQEDRDNITNFTDRATLEDAIP